MATKTKKPKYESPYRSSIVPIGEYKMLVQYTSDEDYKVELGRRSAIVGERLKHDRDLKMTDYFEKRSINILQHLFDTKTADAVLATAMKAVSISFSVYFRYRDFKDLLDQKINEFEYTDEQREILDFVKDSLGKHDLIAPKIGALYTILFKKENVEN
jgi:hypothetical protein